MSGYRVELAPRAVDALEKIARADRKLFQRFSNAIDDIARDPMQGKMLRGPRRGQRSYRLGSYRIVYRVHNQRLLVVVIDLGHRRLIYE